MKKDEEQLNKEIRLFGYFLYSIGPTALSITVYLWGKGLEDAGGMDTSPYTTFWIAACLVLAVAGILMIAAGATPGEASAGRLALARRLIHASAIIHLATTAAFLLSALGH